MSDLTVFFDADCGFCSASAMVVERLDWRHRVRLVPLQSAHEVAADAPAEQALMEQMHARTADGTWVVGSRAWLAIADRLPLLRPLAIAARLPLLRDAMDPGYRLIARNRHRLSRLLGLTACTYRPTPASSPGGSARAR
jgi:predicted DCC family thiol-disulfide oxidoreductase YuxK